MGSRGESEGSCIKGVKKENTFLQRKKYFLFTATFYFQHSVSYMFPSLDMKMFTDSNVLGLGFVC